MKLCSIYRRIFVDIFLVIFCEAVKGAAEISISQNRKIIIHTLRIFY